MTDQFGNYRVEEKISDGGIGRVYAARHTLLDRRVAIKVLHEHYADDPDFRERFLREARAMAALDHLNIARVFEFGEEDGRFFLAMELVEGGSVRSLLDALEGRPLEPDMTVELTRQVAAGLGYAHDLGMIHRDIKPGNLLLERPNADSQTSIGAVKISDFGLVRVADSSIVTAAGTTVGTAAYMSPEQFLGEEFDHRVDIYSLGVVLFELLTGRLPFEGKSAVEVGEQHVHAAVPAPGDVVDAVPDALNAVVMRCLAKLPISRYQSCQELLADLTGQGQENLNVTAPILTGDQERPRRNQLAAGSGGAEMLTEQSESAGRPGSAEIARDRLTLDVHPSEASGRAYGKYELTIASPDDRSARIELSFDSTDPRTKAYIRPRTVVVNPKSVATATLRIAAVPIFGFESYAYDGIVRARSAQDLSGEGRALFVQRPVSIGWLPFAAVGLLVAIVGCLLIATTFAAITDTHPLGIGREESAPLLVIDDANRLYALSLTGDFAEEIVVESGGNLQVGQFVSVAADDDFYYLADAEMHQIVKLASDGEFIAVWGQEGEGPGEFGDLADVAMGPDGRLYVVDRQHSRVSVFEPDGTFIDQYGSSGSEPGQFDSPSGLAFDAIGNFYVVDTGNNRVQKLQSFGAFLLAWGTPGSGNGEFDRPASVAVDDRGNVYVLDGGNQRIQKFDFDGRFIAAWDIPSDAATGLQVPVAITIVEERLYVADRDSGKIGAFKLDGTYDGRLSAETTSPGGSPLDIVTLP